MCLLGPSRVSNGSAGKERNFDSLGGSDGCLSYSCVCCRDRNIVALSCTSTLVDDGMGRDRFR